MALDIPTLHFASASTRGAYVIVFLIWGLRQRAEPYLLHWCASIAASVAGFGVTIWERRHGVPLSGLLAYLLYGTSVALCWSGLRLFNDRPLDRRLMVACGLLPLVGNAAGLAVSAAAGLIGALAGLTVQVGVALAELLRAGEFDRLWSRFVSACGLSLYLAMLLASILLIGLDPAALRDNHSAHLALFLDQSCSVLVYLGFLAMAGERAGLRLRRLAASDPLTGLLNRRGVAQNAARPGAVLLADIDHFKAINDGHGHEAGDAVLVEFARRLRRLLADGDVAARWGGEEFLAVLRGPQAAAADLAERIRAAIEGQAFRIGTTQIRVTVSIGVAALRDGEPNLAPAIRRADGALYRAKQEGRNRVRAAPPGSAAG